MFQAALQMPLSGVQKYINKPGGFRLLCNFMGLKPDYDDAYLGRGTCWFNLSETEKACRDWQKALSLENRQVEQMIRQYCK
jgi:hypothetical protein